jgi:hypothetical protein
MVLHLHQDFVYHWRNEIQENRSTNYVPELCVAFFES